MIPRGEKISVPGYRKCIGHKQYIYTKYKYSGKISVYIVHCLPKPKGATHNRM